MARRAYGDRAACKRCDQDIEWTGRAHGWRDRGGNRLCVAKIVKGEIIQPRAGQKHAPYIETWSGGRA